MIFVTFRLTTMKYFTITLLSEHSKGIIQPLSEIIINHQIDDRPSLICFIDLHSGNEMNTTRNPYPPQSKDELLINRLIELQNCVNN